MGKQVNPYAVRLVVLESGERLPMLCFRATGLPLFETTLYALTELRAKNRSTSTIQQALRSVLLLCLVLDRSGVDLDRRLAEGRILDAGEVEDVARLCRLQLENISFDGASDNNLSARKVASRFIPSEPVIFSTSLPFAFAVHLERGQPRRATASWS